MTNCNYSNKDCEAMFATLEYSGEFLKSDVGGKAYSLNKLINAGVNVPHGFVILADSFFACLKENNVYDDIVITCNSVNAENFDVHSKNLMYLVNKCNFSSTFTAQLKSYLSDNNILPFVSVRSSSVSEDGDNNTFAGIHDSFLNIPCNSDAILNAIKKCWASLFTERSLIYRTSRNLPLFEGMAVIIQNMIQAEAAGVVYTKHPIASTCLYIESSFGLGDSVVEGVVQPDKILIDKDTLSIVSKEVGSKKSYTSLVNGTHRSQLQTEKSDFFSIDNLVITNLISESMKIEKIFGSPQDIEWAYDGQLWILQSRTVNF